MKLRRVIETTALAACAALALMTAGCGTQPAPGTSGPLRAVLTANLVGPGQFLHVAAGPDAAWATTGNALLRVDRRTDQIRTVLTDPSGQLTTISYGAGTVWVSDGDAGLLVISPTTGKVRARLQGLGFIRSFGYGALWSAGYRRAWPALWRTDPVTGKSTAMPLPCLKQFGLAAGAGGVWVSGVCAADAAVPRPPFSSLVRADAMTGRITVRFAVTPQPLNIAAGDGAVWAVGNGAAIRIDPRTGRATATISVPGLTGPLEVPGGGSGLLALSPGSLWVTAAARDSSSARPRYQVLRLSTRTDRLSGVGIALPGTPAEMSASGSTLWVVTTAGLTRIDLVHCAAGSCRPPAPPGPGSRQAGPVWLTSLRMTSASDGWALATTANPNTINPVPESLLRTGDGGRTWVPATPPAARRLLAGGGTPVLLAGSTRQAWLAVTVLAANGSYGTTPSRTVVFSTSDGGRTWTTSAPIRSPGEARWMSFPDPSHGWLMMDLGAAMGQNPVQIYRTDDGGVRWSLAATSPRISTSCDKTGIVFSGTRDGWLSGACNALSLALLVTHDGGTTWQPQPLPVPSGVCAVSGCLVYPPQFSGRSGLLAIAPGNRPPFLLRTDDRGLNWHVLTVPFAARWFGSADLIDARHAVLVPGTPPSAVRGAIRELWFTANGGRTWAAITQAPPLPADATLSFTSPATGFAWNPDAAGVPPLQATGSEGQAWAWFIPRLARG
jgi:photosystem II stability/assembly factor-like uncharacterized protein